ncbi:hypothetical protein F511_45797 [Dorcoceras hygrometricum]|uniref:Uncharacterized protein n=1 Tax=Dorcoceras hygrometricum TaxID=472368 RepID=A0A2Z6ZV52_9LAMI|nr:hypothetical protein F511_45797 [Dorcoceras hygrometricum]
MTFRVVRTNQYNQDFGLIHSTNADDLREQSQESAGSLYIQTQERSDVVEEAIQSQATVHQQMLFGDSDSKTMSFT